MTVQTNDNRYACSKWIVDATGISNGATHSTIAGAITSASSGQTIFVKPGTYTEDLALKDGVHITAFFGDALPSLLQVEIIGKASLAAGSCGITACRLTTSGDFCVEATDTGSISLLGCHIEADDNSSINNSGSGVIAFRSCTGGTGTTGIVFFTNSGAGSISCRYSNIGNVGASVTPSTASSGSIFIQNSVIALPFSTSSTGVVEISGSELSNSGINTATLITAGTGTSTISNSSIFSGTASCVSAGSGTTVTITESSVTSSNTNALTGAGTLRHGNISFNGSSSLIDTTTTVGLDTAPGRITFDGGVNFLDFYQEGTFVPTLTGSGGAPTIAYTTQLGKFTRIGNVVHVKVVITINTISGGSGNIRINTMPFTSANDGIEPQGVVSYVGMDLAATTIDVGCLILVNTTTMALIQNVDDGANIALALSTLSAGDTLKTGITYWV